MSGSHTIVHRPVSGLYGISLTANTASTPLQLISNTNELAQFVYLLNASSSVCVVNISPRSTVATTVSTTPVVNQVAVNPNSYLVVSASTPTVFVSGLSGSAGTLYVQLMQNQ